MASGASLSILAVVKPGFLCVSVNFRRREAGFVEKKVQPPGPYPLWARLAVVWSVDSLQQPLRPAAVDREGGQSERHRVSPPHARSWLCPHLPIDTHCTHVRAGLLLLRASVPRPRLAAPFPPRAACSTCQRHARGAVARLYKQPGVVN